MKFKLLSSRDEGDFQNLLADIRFLAGSRVRSKIIFALMDGERSISDIRRSMMAPDSTITHSLMELESKKLVERSQDSCRLTSKGKLMGAVLSRFIASMDAVRLHRDFWNEHSIGVIPLEFLMKINVFRDAYTLEASPGKLEEPYATYLEMLDSSTHLRAMLSVCLPRHTDAIGRFLEIGGAAEVILTPDSYPVFRRESAGMNLKEAMDSGLLRIGILEEKQEISYIVSDTFFAMSLRREGGSDPSSTRVIMGHGDELLRWGNELFDYHWSLSTGLDSEMLDVNVDEVVPAEE